MDFAEELLSRASPRWLMGWRDIARSTDERTVVGGVFPFSAVGNNLPVWTTDSKDATLLPALLSSFACDFAARVKLGGAHLNFFIAEQLPIPPPEALNRAVPWRSGVSFREWLLPRALELTYTARDLEPFASNCGWNAPPFNWNSDRRFHLRCQLDAALFHLYFPAHVDGRWRPAGGIHGCWCEETPDQLVELERRFATPRDAVAHIMDTFPIVSRKDEMAGRAFRTKQTILSIYDAMQASAAESKPRRTSLRTTDVGTKDRSRNSLPKPVPKNWQ